MKTVPLSTRVTEEEARSVDEMADLLGLDRSAFLKKVIRQGLTDIRFEEACRAYRQRRATLSRAAEMARLGVRDLLLRLSTASLELNYGVDDLQEDLGVEL